MHAQHKNVSSRMRTARLSTEQGVLHTQHPLPFTAPPFMMPPAKEAPPPLCTEWLTNTCENITLPQTSFAGGNK